MTRDIAIWRDIKPGNDIITRRDDMTTERHNIVLWHRKTSWHDHDTTRHHDALSWRNIASRREAIVTTSREVAKRLIFVKKVWHWESELSICCATSFWSYFFIPNTHISPRSQMCWPQVWLLSIPTCWRPIYADICQDKHENMVIKVPKKPVKSWQFFQGRWT